MGDYVNVLLDDLDALLLRLLHLPLAFQMFFWFVAAATVWWIFFWLLGVRKKSLDKKTKLICYTIGTAISLLIASTVIVDNKLKLEEEGLLALRNTKTLGVTSQSAKSSDMVATAEKIILKRHSPIVRAKSIYHEPGLEVIQISYAEKPVEVFLAKLDLNCYEVVLDTAISTKERTSTFAKRFDADIAVNGEAGISPGLKAPLGKWIGNYIVKGEPILLKDNDRRPYMYFDTNSRGYYSNAPQVITTPTKRMYNAIWGRYDLIQRGKVRIDKKDGTRIYPYPRTIVGIDKKGTTLYLLVADGRRGEYSVGLKMKECGKILRAFNVWYAMACDQGGSVCMYVKGLGIVNRPSDGFERPVYTHLGLKKRDCLN